MTYNLDSSADFAKECEAEGSVAMFPAPNELQLDFDSEEEYARHERARDIFGRFFKITHAVVTKSRSGEGYHVRYLLLDPVDALTRIAMQAMLGSDPVREILSYARLTRGDPTPTVLRETQAAAEAIRISLAVAQEEAEELAA